MKSLFQYTCAAILATVVFSSCSKKDDPAPAPNPSAQGKVYLECSHVADGSSLVLDNQWYKNQNGDSFTVSKFNYYLSNIRLNGSGGASYTESNSYHLVEHGVSSSMNFNLANVPAGKYSSITFMIGVDSARNVSGAQTGELDPSKGNFWSWTTGYIMLKFEGNSPKATTPDHKLMMHCGGFSGPNNVLKTVTLNFPSEIEVKNGSSPHVHLQANLLALFQSPNVIDFSTLTTIHMPGANAKMLSDNYVNMFTVTYAGL